MKRLKDKKMMKNLLKTALCLLLVLAMAFSDSAGHIALAVGSEIYVEDIKICVSESEKDAKAYFDKVGYTMVNEDLNPGTGTGKFVYMGYKPTNDPDKAVTSIRMMPMEGGYQLYDYNDIMDYMAAQGARTGRKIKIAADGFAERYNAGSPRAKDALTGLNMYYISSKNNILLGDYILSGKADEAFFTDLVVKASSGTVHAVTNLLNVGLTPFENDYDEETDTLLTVPWAGMVAKSSLWERYAEGLSTDEKKELKQKFEDNAKMLFTSIQQFTTMYENALARFEQNGGVYESGISIKNNDDAVEKMAEMTVEDTDIAYLTAVELLNEYDLDEETKFGDWILSIGRCTLETVDLMQLYPVLDAMGEGMAEIVQMTGFLSAALNLGENTENKDFEKAVADIDGELGEKGKGCIEVFRNMDEEFVGKTFAYTAESVRKQGADNAPLSILERYSVRQAEANETIQKITFVVGIIAIGVGVLVAVGKIGVAVTLSVMGAAAATSTAYMFFFEMAAFMSLIGTCLGIVSIVVLLVSIAVAIGYYIMKKKAKENKAKYQTEKPDYVFDAVEKNGITANVLYKCALDNKDEVGDINAAKQWKWVVLTFSTDKEAGSPIKADENGNIFKAVKDDPSKQEGYDSVKYFGERDAASFNAYCEKGLPVYVHYSTEESLANRTNTVINEPDETEPAETEPAETEPAETGETETTEPGETEEQPTEPATEQSTEPAETEPAKTDDQPKTYIADVIIGIGKDAAEAKSSIIAHDKKYYVLDYNLSPDQSFQTYLGYLLTEDPKEAITDLRVAPYAAGERQDVTCGDAVYHQIGILGYYVGKGSKQNTPPGDALYYTTSASAGSPIAADSLHPVAAPKDAEAGWEPVSFFGSDLAYNFNSRFEFQDDEDRPIHAMSNYGTKKDHDLNNLKSVYLFYEPTEKYTSGTKYLSGIFFIGGADTRDTDHKSSWEIYGRISDFVKKVNADPRCEVLTDVNLIKAVQFERTYSGEYDLVQYLSYTWTYNPKRAVSDLALFQADAYSTSLPYMMSKPTDGISRNYVAAISLRQNYGVSGNVRTLVRYPHPNNSFMARDGSWPDVYADYISKGYTTTLPEGITFGYSKTPILTMGFYVCGPAEGLEPLTLDDVIVTKNINIEHETEGTSINWKITDKTLAGNAPDAKKSFRPIAEMKDPNAETVYSLAYPTYNMKYDNDDFDTHYNWSGTTSPLTIFLRGQQETKKTYIASLSVGSFSRQQFKEAKKDVSDDDLEQVDSMANLQAMAGAASGCSDEVIVMNLAADNQNDAWYNRQKKGVGSIEAPENVPAAYIGVSRTDSPTQAITGVILYKCKAKTAPNSITVEKVEYICAGVSAPIYMKGVKYFLYYTYNSGATPGKPIREITIDSVPLINGSAANLCFDEGGSSLYGNGNQSYYIHLFYEHDSADFFNKLYIGRGASYKAAMLDLLAQGCTEFLDMDLNVKVKGDTIYLGYRTGSYDWEEIDQAGSDEERQELMADQEQEAVYDIVVTKDEPFHPEGIISKGVYYYPVSDVSLNANKTNPYGAELYMYYATPFYSAQYNKKNNEKTTLPQDVFSGYVRRLGFAENERVPYTTDREEEFKVSRTIAYQMGWDNLADYMPWEYVLQSGDLAPVDLNEGMVSCNGDYCEDTRLHMFVQREDYSVKPAGQITGGFIESTYDVGDIYYKK